jgi:hypothetical protein
MSRKASGTLDDAAAASWRKPEVAENASRNPILHLLTQEKLNLWINLAHEGL